MSDLNKRNIDALNETIICQQRTIDEMQMKILVMERAIGTINNQLDTLNKNFALAVAENRHDVHRK